MRIGDFEVQLVDDQGKPLSTEREHEGKMYSDATPGQEYNIKVNMYRNRSSGIFAYKYIRIGVFVDGVDVNYWKRFDLSNEKLWPANPSECVSAIFQGFKRDNDDIRHFVFASPKDVQVGGTGSQETKPLGSIKVEIFKAQVEGGVYNNVSKQFTIPTSHEQTTKDNVKFWKQASVATVGGRPISAKDEPFVPLVRWSNAEKILTMEMSYHTKLVLDLLIASCDGNKNSSKNSSSGAKVGAGREPAAMGELSNSGVHIKAQDGTYPSPKKARQDSSDGNIHTTTGSINSSNINSNSNSNSYSSRSTSGGGKEVLDDYGEAVVFVQAKPKEVPTYILDSDSD